MYLLLTGEWRVGDTEIPPLAELIIYGVLELDHGDALSGYRDFTIQTSYIVILGGRLIVGWEDKPFLGNVHILLQGHWFTQEYFIPADDVTIGSKVIGKKNYILLFDSIFIFWFKDFKLKLNVSSGLDI